MPWYWVNYNINISLKHKYVFFEIPKTGCTTIKRTLINWEMGEFADRWQGKTHRNIYETPFVKPFQLEPDHLHEVLTGSEFFRFTFVRSPYSRLVSCYLEKIAKKKIASEVIYQALGKSLDNDNTLSISEFLDGIEKLSPEKMDSHFRPQFHQSFGGHITFDYVGRFEEFESDFSAARRLIQCSDDYYQTEQSHKVAADKRVGDLLGNQEISRINELYSKDFDAFHYSLISQ